ncbi:MAG: Uma2 family endonuclease [Clostridiales bacterium]|jgi:Uma2 family endonuclease|nr:Uma2 family endonuclease [Clostridiales bacterium]
MGLLQEYLPEIDSEKIQSEERKWELIDGIPTMLMPGAPGHTYTNVNMLIPFYLHFKNSPCKVFIENMKFHLTEKDRFIPDIAVLCDTSIVKKDGAHGPPDLVVEVLSPTTARNDEGHKMRIYGESGVKEYWIVDIKNYSIRVYVNQGGKMELYDVYMITPREELEFLKSEGKTIPATSLNSLTFPDLAMDLYEIFADVLPEDY